MNKSRIINALRVSRENLEDDVATSIAGADGAAATDGDAAAVDPAADGGEVVAAEPAAVEEPDLIDQGEGEVAEAGAEVEANTEVVEGLDDAAAALESIFDAMIDVREEGMSPQTARMAAIAVANVTDKLGMESLIPSQEHFTGQTPRHDATQLSIEQLGKSIKELWKAIWEWIKAMKDSLMHFLQSIFTQLGRAEARFSKLTKQVVGLKSSAKANKAVELELGPLISRFHVGGKAPASFVAALNAVTATIKSCAPTTKKAVAQAEGYRNWLAEMARSGERDESVPDFAKAMSFEAGGAFKHEEKTDGGVIYRTDELPGGVTFWVGSKKSITGQLTLNYMASGKDSTGTKVSVATNKVKAPNPQELANIMVAVGELIVAAREAQKDTAAEVAKTKEAFKGIKIGAEGDDETAFKDRVALRAAMRAYKNAEGEVGKATSRVIAYGCTLANDIMNVVQKALAAYGGAPAKAAAAK